MNMKNVHNQTGNLISIPSSPRRIISLAPSQTELLYDPGLDKEVIGITKFCVHPPQWFSIKTRVGGTNQLNLKRDMWQHTLAIPVKNNGSIFIRVKRMFYVYLYYTFNTEI
jgi:hypothetical protein